MKINKQWYSVILSLMLVGLLLVLTTGIFHMILKEMLDTRGIWNAMKANAAAEWAQEVALWQLKEYGYWFAQNIPHDINKRSIALSENPKDIWLFKQSSDVFFSNIFDAKSDNYDGKIVGYQTHLIPLFYQEEVNKYTIDQSLEMYITWWEDSNLVWNILAKSEGITWVGWFDTYSYGNKKDNEFQNFSEELVETFLYENKDTKNYLILYNAGDTEIEYNLLASSEFVKPEMTIVSSAQIGKYKQNILTKFSNKEFLYSIFSN
jgi:hypothetical protein